MNKETVTTTKAKRPYRKTGKYSQGKTSKGTLVNVKNIQNAISALEALTETEQRLVLSSYRSVFSKLN